MLHANFQNDSLFTFTKSQLASWSYNGDELDVTNRTDKGESDFFVDSGEWNLLGIPVRRNVEYYPCCPQPYPDVTFQLIFQVICY